MGLRLCLGLETVAVILCRLREGRMAWRLVVGGMAWRLVMGGMAWRLLKGGGRWTAKELRCHNARQQHSLRM